jgi:alkylation response protein AidB-like acyl-CoA dehydrogenase
MPEYKAPLRDIQFVFNELLNAEQHYAGLAGCEQVTPDLVSAIVQEGARFAEEVLSPLNRVGDQQGCTWSEAGVTTPEGFAQAYAQFVAGGWPGIRAPAEHGGQGLPGSLGAILNEMMGAANWAWSMYPGLTEAAVRCLEHYGSPELQKTYLTKLVAGTWSGTMCLTEAHCGSDLGLLRTKAAPRADGSYAITGTKIFISSGEHDLTENIVHLVLARIEGAPAGTKGISLFVVPKFLPDAQGEKGERNGVSCGSIEHKMGINGSATCVMNFDGATGFLVGEEHRGLKYMFVMMNAARLGTAVQGLAQAELSYQGALRYARERLQMRSLSGPKNPDGPADPIIVHPDVRRMLLTQKAVVEGSRAFIYWLAQQVDIVDRGSEADAGKADALLSLLTPVAKAFITELGYECTNLGMQVYGGHGYISEWGMEQIVRDTRIALT